MRPSTRFAGVLAVAVAAELSGPARAAQASQAGAIQAHGTLARPGAASRLGLHDQSGRGLPRPRRRWRGIHRHLNDELAIKRQ